MNFLYKLFRHIQQMIYTSTPAPSEVYDANHRALDERADMLRRRADSWRRERRRAGVAYYYDTLSYLFNFEY